MSEAHISMFRTGKILRRARIPALRSAWSCTQFWRRSRVITSTMSSWRMTARISSITTTPWAPWLASTSPATEQTTPTSPSAKSQFLELDKQLKNDRFIQKFRKKTWLLAWNIQLRYFVNLKLKVPSAELNMTWNFEVSILVKDLVEGEQIDMWNCLCYVHDPE